jgi:hypothetical protein
MKPQEGPDQHNLESTIDKMDAETIDNEICGVCDGVIPME